MKQKITLSNILSRGANNFDLLRLLAALLVIFGHGFATQNPGHDVDPIKYALDEKEYPGSLAVYAFFLMSGILITQSYERQDSFFRYAVLRFARIWPGLCVNLLVTVFVIGPLFAHKTLVHYFTHTNALKYLGVNILPWGLMRVSIIHVFDGTFTPGAVNWPLWTLPLEVKCYALVGLLGVLGLIKNRRVFFPLCVFLFGVFLVVAYGTHWPWEGFFVLMGSYSFYPVPFFLMGMACYALRERIVLDWRWAVALWVGYGGMRCLFPSDHPWASLPFLYAGLAYGVLVLASLPSLRRWNPANDYSYGLYIYGCVCQQMVSSLFHWMPCYPGILVSMTLTLGVASLSWHWVEKPALDFFHRRVARRRAVQEGLPEVAARPCG